MWACRVVHAPAMFVLALAEGTSMTPSSGWPSCGRVLMTHIKTAALISAPLFLVLVSPGELRALSLLSVGFVVMMAYSIESVQPVDPCWGSAEAGQGGMAESP